MTRIACALAVPLALAACGGKGTSPLTSVNSGVYAVNALISALGTTAGTLGRTRSQYGQGGAWTGYQQPYQQRSTWQ